MRSSRPSLKISSGMPRQVSASDISTPMCIADSTSVNLQPTHPFCLFFRPEPHSSHRVYPMGIVDGMTVSYALLGLLQQADRHGYDLKQTYDRRFGATRPLRFGQVYRTLAQLQRDGLITIVGVESGAGPDRKRYSITAEGV